MTSASAVAVPAESRTVVLRKSVKRTGLRARPPGARARRRGRPVSRSASPSSSGGASSEPTADAHGVGERAGALQRAQRAEGVEVGDVVADVHRAGERLLPRGVAVQEGGDALALVEGDRGAHLEHLAAPVHGEALGLRARGELADGGRGGLLVGDAAPVEGGDRPLVLGAHAQALQLGGVRAGGERAYALAPLRERGVELGACGARAQQLAAVGADVRERADRHDLPRGGRLPAGDAAHQAVALGELDQQRARGLGDVGVIGVADDRGERAVDVEQHGRVGGVGAQGCQRLRERGGGGHGP